MYAHTSHAGDSQAVSPSAPVGPRATPVTQASGARVVGPCDEHTHANDGDRAPNNHRQASAA